MRTKSLGKRAQGRGRAPMAHQQRVFRERSAVWPRAVMNLNVQVRQILEAMWSQHQRSTPCRMRNPPMSSALLPISGS